MFVTCISEFMRGFPHTAAAKQFFTVCYRTGVLFGQGGIQAGQIWCLQMRFDQYIEGTKELGGNEF